MKSLIESLSSPAFVAHFQRICGVQWKYPEEGNLIYPSERTFNDDSCIIKNNIIHRIMHLGSQLAGEPFYYIFLPVSSWILDVAVARRTLTNLALVMYIGQSAKDILQETRPPSPPVIRLEKMYETEYGMPSTHTMAGAVTSFALVLFSRQFYQIPHKQCLTAATIWTAWVGTSRIYLGMHTCWQVLVGAFGAVGLLYSSVSAVTRFDELLVENGIATCCAVAGSMILSHVIFRLDSGLDPETRKPRWNTARGDQTEIMGFTAGFLVGSRWAILHSLYTYRIADDVICGIPMMTPKLFALRMLVGGLIALPASLLFKKVFFYSFSKLSGLSFKDKTALKQHPKVELPYKFTSSFLTGALCTSAIPWVLNELHMW